MPEETIVAPPPVATPIAQPPVTQTVVETTATPPANPLNNVPVNGNEDGVTLSQLDDLFEQAAGRTAKQPDVVKQAVEAPVVPAEVKPPTTLEVPAAKSNEQVVSQPIKVDFKMPSTLPATRNYEGLTPEEQSVFKAMNNDAYAYLRPIYDEHKKLKPEYEQLKTQFNEVQNKESQSYYQHKDAFVLHPEFQAASQNAQRAEYEINYWTEQLVALRNGKAPQQLTITNEGQYGVGAELPVNAKTEAHINQMITRATQWHGQQQQAAQQIATNYQTQTNNAINEIKRVEDHYFPFFKDGAEHPYKDTIKQVKQALGPFQSDPLANLVAKSYATMQHIYKQLQEVSASSLTPELSTNLSGATSTLATLLGKLQPSEFTQRLAAVHKQLNDGLNAIKAKADPSKAIAAQAGPTASATNSASMAAPVNGNDVDLDDLFEKAKRSRY